MTLFKRISVFLGQGTHCTGKTGKTQGIWKFCQKQGIWFAQVVKHREFGKFAKTQGIWCAQVVNSLILKVNDISIFAAKIPNFLFIFKLARSTKSVLCI